MTHVCIIVGARPNFMKVAPLVRALQETENAQYTLIYAGREDDPTLETQLFSDLQLEKPHVYLGVDSQRINEITSRVMAALDSYFDHHATDVVVVVDDLASTMAAAIVAKKRGLRLAHLVAGTRSFDPKEPKEINRLVIDALSDYLFTASGHSNTIAAREQQTETSQTYMVGNILMDTLRYSLPRLRKPDIRLTEGDYLLLTLNRRLLLADENRLQPLLHELAATDCHIIAPLRGNAAEIVKRLCPKNQNLSIIDALPYLEFTWLTAHAKGIVTDSGNIAEEATFLGIPCITLNEHAEHQETVTTGTNELVGTDSARLRQALTTLMSGKWKKGNLPDRWDGRTAERMVKILISS